jgi:2-polyprenyl-6-methoxyphenol hydroxylase-like FAD-dependent oxidoreductase
LRSILFKRRHIDHYLSRGIRQWTIDNGQFQAFLVTYSDGRWALKSNSETQDSLDEEGQKSMIRKVIGEDVDDIEIVTHGKWDLAGSIADRFSSGLVFLAGDAAHTLPSNRGGYGANTGIAAWKLAAALEGKAQPSLLTRMMRSVAQWQSSAMIRSLHAMMTSSILPGRTGMS